MLLEVGSVRAQHAKAICVKNAVDFLVCTMTWLFVGYPLAFGDNGALGKFAGTTKWMGNDISPESTEWAFFFFQWTFCASTSTIVSGSGAERCSFKGYIMNTIVLSSIVYPVVVHWVWAPDAWLSTGDYKFYDFAGSGVVHLTGGACALVFAYLVGAREGRFLPDGTPQTIQPHNMVLACCGVLLLVLGWFGFNGGSVGTASGGSSSTAGRVCMMSALGAASGGLSSFAIVWNTEGFICLHAIANGILAGLVSVTAGAPTFSPFGALMTGLIGGCVYRAASRFILYLKIDDPLEASPIHGFCGVWGCLAVGLFACDSGVTGLFYGDAEQLGHQIFGVLVITAWTAGSMGTILGCMKMYSKTLLRTPLDIELAGDFVLYNGGAYPQFESDNVAPPSGHMAIVHMAVMDAIELQEWNPDVMAEALEVYDEVLMDNAQRFHAYEISREGDSIAYVFHNALDSINFCLTLQQCMMVSAWPDELLAHPKCAKEGKVWRGLRVKMAVHVGIGNKFMNHSANRLAYDGVVVEETAAIVSHVDVGGTVTVSTHTLAELQGKFSHRVSEMPQFAIQDLGTYLLPKVQDPLALIQIMPNELNTRNSTTLTGCVKLACSYAEAPGVLRPGSKIALMFCSLKFAGGQDKTATRMLADQKKDKRASKDDKVAKGQKQDDAFLADLMRTCAFSNNGYVTKTSGGVSLLTFHESANGLGFVKDVMAACVQQTDKPLAFHAGLHLGTPSSAFPNKGSGRADYLGPPVNTSARLLALSCDKGDFKSGDAGQYGCAISRMAYDTLDEAEQNKLHSTGKHPLKGVKGDTECFAYRLDGTVGVPSMGAVEVSAAEPASAN